MKRIACETLPGIERGHLHTQRRFFLCERVEAISSGRIVRQQALDHGG